MIQTSHKYQQGYVWDSSACSPAFECPLENI